MTLIYSQSCCNIYNWPFPYISSYIFYKSYFFLVSTSLSAFIINYSISLNYYYIFSMVGTDYLISTISTLLIKFIEFSNGWIYNSLYLFYYSYTYATNDKTSFNYSVFMSFEIFYNFSFV